MKIEMGESLFYSWLRHVKDCPIVQTNWTTSSQWNLQQQDKLEAIMEKSAAFFAERYGFQIYKHTASLSQLLQQAECDAIGLASADDTTKVYAVDVAFHEGGLNYGDKRTTTMKIISKCLRTAMCIYGYLNTDQAEVIFASPKIHKAVMSMLQPCMQDIQRFMDQEGYHFRFRLIANESFKKQILDPILIVSKGVADTNELFLRSYQLIQLFEMGNPKTRTAPNAKVRMPDTDWAEPYAELKIGILARTVMAELLENGAASDDEIEALQTEDYSWSDLGLNYPCLVAADSSYDRKRYYVHPLHIRGKEYYLCSQWFETAANNDRPMLMRWIQNHSVKA